MIRIITTLLFSTTLLIAFAQTDSYTLKLQSGEFTLSNNAEGLTNAKVAEWPAFNDQRFGVVRLGTYPTNEEWSTLSEMGIKNLGYVPNRSFMVSIANGSDLNALNQYEVLASSGYESDFKGVLDVDFAPERAKQDNEYLFNTHFFASINTNMALASLRAAGAEVIELEEKMGYALIKANAEELASISNKPFIQYFDWNYDAGQPENYTSRTLARANYISPENTNGIGYDGSGIAVALQDDGSIDNHLDHHGRIIEQFWNASLGDHGDHVGGTINGAGNLNPYHEGLAKGSDLYVYKAAPEYQAYDSIDIHYFSKDVVITSTSYSNGCNAGYTALARLMDAQIYDMESLLHVFSAGNSGTSNCGYGAGNTWGNITGGHKVGKNVMTVANLTDIDGLATSSSKGPAHDGRIKPDISAKGTQVTSTIENNEYGVKTGTSMSCPAISGTMAVLYEAFEDQQGALPASGLIKAIALNTCDDLGNVGPDFKHGWGRINARKAYEVIESTSFTEGTISNGDSAEFTIAVPNNSSSARFMLYWTDPEASVNASTALVNDLDLTVVDPSSNVALPYLLNHAANAFTLDDPATPGTDHLNNVEQVEFFNPASGNYTVKVKGFNVPQGPQKFYVVYWFKPTELVLTYPVGGESFVPFNTEKIRWDSPYESGNATIEYSNDGGNNWFPISSNTPISQGYVNWNVPSIATGNVRVRVTYNGETVESDDLSVIRIPSGLTIDYACPDSIGLSWDNTSGATGYTVHRLGQKYMKEWGTSSTTEYVDYNSNLYNEMLWYSVSSNGNNGAEGKRAVAIHHIGGVFNCVINDDAGLVSMTPAAGSIFSCHGDSLAISFEVVNNGTYPITSIDAVVTSSTGQTISETIQVNIAPNDVDEITLTEPLEIGFSMQTARLVIDIFNDGNSYNDTIISTYYPYNTPTLGAIWSEDFETFDLCSTDSDCEATVCDLSNGWVNEVSLESDDHDWRTNRGQTPSQFTGPANDHTTGNPSGKYLYVEASGGCTNATASLTSPCIDLINVDDATLTFWYHMNGSDMGSLHLDIFDGTSWTLDVFEESGDQGSTWNREMLSLSAFYGKIINLRFRGVSGFDWSSDIAIDDIEITTPPVANFTYTLQNDAQTVMFTDLSLYGDTMIFDLGDGTSLDNVPNTYFYPDLETYQVRQIVGNDYGIDTAIQVISNLSVQEYETQRFIFPNPARHTLNIASNDGVIGLIDLLSIDGSLLQSFDLSARSNAEIRLEDYPSGLYLLVFEDGDVVELSIVK